MWRVVLVDVTLVVIITIETLAMPAGNPGSADLGVCMETQAMSSVATGNRQGQSQAGRGGGDNIRRGREAEESYVTTACTASGVTVISSFIIPTGI